MRLQIWMNKAKMKDEDADFIALQKQRTGIEGKGYETVEVGRGWTQQAPSGETYVDLKIEGLTNNKPS